MVEEEDVKVEEGAKEEEEEEVEVAMQLYWHVYRTWLT